MKLYIQRKLADYAEAVIRKYHPLVIGITGSVGKTSAKEAVFAVLSSQEGVATNPKNFNNEIGTPLSVLQIKSAPGRNPAAWAKVFFLARRLLSRHLSYPKTLILELGIDHPGDMDYLADIVRPQIAVITALGNAHIEYFGSVERIAEEKIKIFKYLGSSGTAILNYEDERLRMLAPELSSKVLSYGFQAAADIRAVSIYTDEKGTGFTVEHRNESKKLFLPGLLGSAHVLACLAGVSVGLAYGLSFTEIVENLKRYHPQPGRMRLLSGIQDSILIDDSYNSSPQAALMAIKELAKFPAKHKIAVLGDMRELGAESEKAHRELALPLSNNGIQDVVLVGSETMVLALELIAVGYPREHIYHYKTAYDAALVIPRFAARDTVFLIKGSQNTIRMERVVKALLLHPESASKVLVRQDKSWLKKNN